MVFKPDDIGVYKKWQYKNDDWRTDAETEINSPLLTDQDNTDQHSAKANLVFFPFPHTSFK